MLELLAEREKNGNLRELRKSSSLIDFTSNDYLGLARSKKLKEMVDLEWSRQETVLNGLGSTGSRLLSGNQDYCELVEREIADFHGYDSALIFNCGFMANLALLSSIPQEKDTILYDTGVHASTHEGIRLSAADAIPWRHNDVEHLEKRLKETRHGQVYVCIDAIYSTDGSIAPLEEIADLCQQYDARLIVDEAHSVGVYGGGLLRERVFAKVVTFGKAFGVQGAAVLGNETLRKFLINFGKSFIYTTALPLYAFMAIRCAYRLISGMDREREHLQKLIRALGLSATAIQPFLTGSNAEAKRKALQLNLEGFDVRPLLRPTVPRGQECLRICLHSFNTMEEVERLKGFL